MMMQNYPNYMQAYNPPYQPNFQPIQQNASIPGRVVDDFAMVGANDVPMDGNASVFMKRDLSEIQVRKWGSDGRIYSTTYKPFNNDLNISNSNTPTNNQEDNFNGLNERLQAIEDKIDRLIKPTTAKKGTNDVNN